MSIPSFTLWSCAFGHQTDASVRNRQGATVEVGGKPLLVNLFPLSGSSEDIMAKVKVNAAVVLAHMEQNHGLIDQTDEALSRRVAELCAL